MKKLFKNYCLYVDIRQLTFSSSFSSLDLLLRMDLSSLFDDLQLSSSSETPRSSQTLPPITEFLSELQKKLLNMLPYSKTLHLIGRVENLFRTADPDWLFSPRSGLAELQVEYNAVVEALVKVAALPLCEDDCGSLPDATYQSIPSQAVTVCSALTALLETLGNRGVQTGIPRTIAPSVLVFAVTHFQVRVHPEFPGRVLLSH